MINATAPKSRAASIPAYILLVCSPLIGGISLLLIGGFWFFGSFHITDFGLGKIQSLLLDAGLCLLFFTQHSVMIRKPFHQWLSGFVREEYQPAVYSISSGIVLTSLVIFWQETEVVINIPVVFAWVLRGAFILGLLGTIAGFRSIKGFDPYGIKLILRNIKGKETRQIPFTVSGIYRWMRHPLYFFCLVMIWTYPYLTGDRILFNLLWTGWIIIGTFLEERDLVAVFGEDYRNYQKTVPMLVPWKF